MGQIFQIRSEDGAVVDAHYEIEDSAIIYHSRGGTKGKGAINTDYALGLSILLARLSDASIKIEQVWVDSSRVQNLPISERTILSTADSADSPEQILRKLSTRMKAVGRSPTDRSGGNSTRRIRLKLNEDSPSVLISALSGLPVARDMRSLDRLPAESLRSVSAEHVWRAVQELLAGAESLGFGPSTDYDLIAGDGLRLPPKAVFGLAATYALGFQIMPRHFTAGLSSVCFEVLEDAGFRIVPKGEQDHSVPLPLPNDDRLWAEGRPKLIAHLRRERALGLSFAKKAEFRRVRGRLFCERCLMDPIVTYGGEHGEACIEVHHHVVQVAQMEEGHQSRLDELQCLCASCHRVVHRELREAAL